MGTAVNGRDNHHDHVTMEILCLAGLQKRTPHDTLWRTWRALGGDLFPCDQGLIFHQIVHWRILTGGLENEARVSGSTHRSCLSLDALCFPPSGRQSFRGLPQSLAGAEAWALFRMKRYWKAGCSNWSLHLQPPASEAAGLWCCVCAFDFLNEHWDAAQFTGPNVLEGIQAARLLSPFWGGGTLYSPRRRDFKPCKYIQCILI